MSGPRKEQSTLVGGGDAVLMLGLGGGTGAEGDGFGGVIEQPRGEEEGLDVGWRRRRSSCREARAAAVTGGWLGRGRRSRFGGPGLSSIPTNSVAGIMKSGLCEQLSVFRRSGGGVETLHRCGDAPGPENWGSLGGAPLASPGDATGSQRVRRGALPPRQGGGG